MIKKFAILFLLLSVAGCASQEKIVTKTVLVEKPPLNLTPQKVDPNKLKSVSFEVFSFNDSVNFCLSLDNYQNLSLNALVIKNYLIEQRAIINAYKEYYESLSD